MSPFFFYMNTPANVFPRKWHYIPVHVYHTLKNKANCMVKHALCQGQLCFTSASSARILEEIASSGAAAFETASPLPLTDADAPPRGPLRPPSPELWVCARRSCRSWMTLSYCASSISRPEIRATFALSGRRSPTLSNHGTDSISGLSN